MEILLPFVSDSGCKSSYLLTEIVFPEAKDQTILMRMASLC